MSESSHSAEDLSRSSIRFQGAWVCWSQQCWPLRGMAPVATSPDMSLWLRGCEVLSSISNQQVHFLSDALKSTAPRTEHFQYFAVKFPSKSANLKESRRHSFHFPFADFPTFRRCLGFQIFPGRQRQSSCTQEGQRRVMFDWGHSGRGKPEALLPKSPLLLVFYVAGCFNVMIWR